MREILKKWAKFRVLEPARHLADHALDLAARSARPRAIRLLVASDDAEYTSEQQLAPLRAHRAALREELGVMFGHMLLGDALTLPSAVLRTYDGILIKLGFRTPPQRALELVRGLRERVGPNVKLLYLDGDDDAGVLWPELLPWLDVYVKKHVFADASEYTHARIGKSNLTDHVARTTGFSFEADPIPSTSEVPAELIPKIVLGWNIALDDKIARLSRASGAGVLDEERSVDVVCRASFSESWWIAPFRAPVAPILRRLEPTYRVLTPVQRVSQEEYHREMRQSRICVSPFGFGEICWRDFEAVLSGCLLVKPDMSHLRTQPNIFVPHETYVPVRWDFADLEDVLRYYLERDEERERIRRRAYGALCGWHEGGGFVRSFARVLGAAGIARER